MRTFFIISVILILSGRNLAAQTFEAHDSLGIPYLSNMNGEFADLNNDGNFDFLLFGLQDSTNSILPLVFSYAEEMWTIDTLTIDTLADTRFIVTDVNNDNKLDIVGLMKKDSVSSLAIAYQTGNFEFSNVSIIDSLSTPYFQVEDLNNDGYKELIYTYKDSLEYNLRILNQKEGSWEEDTVLLSVPYGPQLVFDFDNNNFRDIYITGSDTLDSPFSILISNNNDTLNTTDSVFLQLKNASLTLGDYNHDGIADILGAGIGMDSLFHSMLYLSGGDSIALDSLSLDSLGVVKAPDYFMADFNSDGLTDMIIKGIDKEDSTVNYLLKNSNEGNYTLEQLDTLFSAGAIQRFADLDCDGDLDKILINPGVESLGSFLIFYKNVTPEINTPPGLAPRFAAFQIENEINLYWEGVPDDHTPEKSLTFDVFVTSATSGIMLPAFDLNNEKRMVIKQGNNGYNNEIIVRDISPGVYDYGVQSIDNSFNNSGCLEESESGLCSGSFVYCYEIGFEEVVACIGETITLRAKDENTGWYSMRKGFLGFSGSVSLKVNSSDTVYNDASGDVPCFERRRWIIKPERVKLNFEDVTACKDELLQFELNEAHDSVQWISTNSGLLSSLSTMEVIASIPDTIIVEVYKSSCFFSDTFYISITTPIINLNGSQFKIYGGQSVQLQASGVADYSWKPTEGLDNAFISDPLATPLKNTTYKVTGVDTLGCIVVDSVLIIVENVAFVASLFTPNGDTKNDALLIYGLTNAADFSFQIYDRSGVLVYQTNDISEATNKGWDGDTNGRSQQNGVYYWKISGVFPDGKKVLLNGKDSGAVHLIR